MHLTFTSKHVKVLLEYEHHSWINKSSQDRSRRTRVRRAQSPDSLAIGIESGIFRFCGVTLDIAIVVLLRDADIVVTTSQGIQYPENCVEIAEEHGFETTTVASVIAERFGGDATDPHTTLSKGRLTRTMTLIDALTTALQQL